MIRHLSDRGATSAHSGGWISNARASEPPRLITGEKLILALVDAHWQGPERGSSRERSTADNHE